MSIFGSIVGFFTGGSSTADSVIDGVKKAGDMMWYTDEEKAIGGREGFKLWIEYQKATLPQNAARRMIAKVIVLLWAGIVVYMVLTASIGFIFDLENFKALGKYLFKVLTDVVMIPFGLIIGFYFLKRMIPNKNND